VGRRKGGSLNSPAAACLPPGSASSSARSHCGGGNIHETDECRVFVYDIKLSDMGKDAGTRIYPAIGTVGLILGLHASLSSLQEPLRANQEPGPVITRWCLILSLILISDHRIEPSVFRISEPRQPSPTLPGPNDHPPGTAVRPSLLSPAYVAECSR
jgi:hypothetical protein